MKQWLLNLGSVALGIALWFIFGYDQDLDDAGSASLPAAEDLAQEMPVSTAKLETPEPIRETHSVEKKAVKELERSTRQRVKKELGAEVVEEFEPERRVVQHPQYGLLVQLIYPKGAVRYEFPGPDDTEATHDFEPEVRNEMP